MNFNLENMKDSIASLVYIKVCSLQVLGFVLYAHYSYLTNRSFCDHSNRKVKFKMLSFSCCLLDIHMDNKAISMMRWKSPRSDVEMPKKLNFVAAVLDFWRAFLNQFWPNLVHTYKIHFWISLVLWLVFKCQVISDKKLF